MKELEHWFVLLQTEDGKEMKPAAMTLESGNLPGAREFGEMAFKKFKSEAGKNYVLRDVVRISPAFREFQEGFMNEGDKK